MSDTQQKYLTTQDSRALDKDIDITELHSWIINFTGDVQSETFREKTRLLRDKITIREGLNQNQINKNETNTTDDHA